MGFFRGLADIPLHSGGRGREGVADSGGGGGGADTRHVGRR